MRRYIGYASLVVFAVVLMGATIHSAYSENIFLSLAFVPFIIAMLYVFRRAFIETKNLEESYGPFSRKALYDFLATSIASVITFILSTQAGLGAVTASGAVGLVAAIAVKPYAVPIFCGSFLGMCSPDHFSMGQFIIASVVVGVIFVATKDVFNGYGGKLGTIAFGAALLTGIIVRADFLDPIVYDSWERIHLVAASVVGAVTAYIISIRFKAGPVFGSAVVGVVAGPLLPFIFGDFGIDLAIAAFGASFVGMSSPEKLRDERYIFLAGVMFGFIFVLSAPFFNGAGGKLGTIAFISAMMIGGVRIFLERKIFTGAS